MQEIERMRIFSETLKSLNRDLRFKYQDKPHPLMLKDELTGLPINNRYSDDSFQKSLISLVDTWTDIKKDYEIN